MIAGQISGDGECNWFEGVQLLSVYLIIAVLFYFLPEPAHVRESAASAASGRPAASQVEHTPVSAPSGS